jgi:hypothetical protein
MPCAGGSEPAVRQAEGKCKIKMVYGVRFEVYGVRFEVLGFSVYLKP